ncbi:MAG TPA: hypothetical protein VEX38_00970 [Fimbriimonadaceae bacterium]|nr:hypothetical protein [Fimbriimonadaceae bacterium]
MDRVIVKERDARHHRGQEASKAVGRSARGPNRRVTDWSPRSRRRALEELRNAKPYACFATLTFCRKISSDKEVAPIRNRLLTILVRRGFRVCCKREWHVSGQPHLHLLLDPLMMKAELREIWGRATQVEVPPVVHVRVIPPDKWLDALYYMVKKQGHHQNRVPEGYDPSHRYIWYREPSASAYELEIVGPRPVISKVARPLASLYSAKIRRRNQGGRGPRDNGFSGRLFYDCGGSVVADTLERLVVEAAGAAGCAVRVSEGRRGRKWVRLIEVAAPGESP